MSSDPNELHEAEVLLAAKEAKEELGIMKGDLKIDPVLDVKKHYQTARMIELDDNVLPAVQQDGRRQRHRHRFHRQDAVDFAMASNLRDRRKVNGRNRRPISSCLMQCIFFIILFSIVFCIVKTQL